MYRVLIADDDPFILEGLHYILDWASLGLEIVGSAENGLDAKAYIEKNQVDVLVTDIRMPGMDGTELIEWIRSEGLDIRCIVLSGYDDYSYLHRAMKLGIENYLIKSINESELFETLRAVVDQLDHARTRRDELSEVVLRDNILLRWMLGRISHSEFSERTDYLGISERHGAFRVYAFRPLPAAQDQVCNLNAAYHDVQKVLHAAGVDGLPLFRDLDDDVILIDLGDRVPRSISLSRLNDDLERESAVSWFLTSGSVAADFDHASESYRQAKRLMGYALMCPEVGFAQWEDTSGMNPQLPVSIQNMRNHLLSGDRLHVQADIDDTLSQVFSPQSQPPDFLHEYALRVCVQIMDAAVDRGISLPEPFMTIDMVQDVIRGIRNKDVLRTWLHEAIDSFFSRYESGREGYSPIVNRTIEHISKHYQEGLSLKMLANRFGANAAYLGRIFAEEVGESFSMFLNRVRIEQACRLLVETSEPVSRIAELTGYTSANYFVNVFKRYTCSYPSRYRLEHRSDV